MGPGDDRAHHVDRGGGSAEGILTDPVRCAWCDRPFTPRQTGGHDQRFCRPSCRRALHAAARRWALAELAAGRLALSAIKNGLPATRALATGGGMRSPTLLLSGS